MSHRLHALLVALAALSMGCGDDASRAEAGETTPPPPATTAAPGTTTTATDEGTTTTTGSAPSGCDCASGEYCAAPHQAGVIDPQDDALVYGCRAECVPLEDPSVWCRSDVPSCCAGLTCDEFGFCVDPNAVDTTSGSGSGSGSGTSGATTSGSDSGSTTDATGSGTATGTGTTGVASSTSGG